MNSVFFKTFSFKNINQFKFLLKLLKYDNNIIIQKNLSLFCVALCQRNRTHLSSVFCDDRTGVPLPNIVVELLSHVRKEDADQTLTTLQKMKKGFVRKIPLNEMTAVIHLLIKNKKIFDLSCCVQAMSYIIDNSNVILKPLFEKYSNSADLSSLNKIADAFPDFTLMKCSFNDYLIKAYILNEKYEDLLLELEKRWDTKNKLFSVFAFEEILKRSEYKERAVKLAKKYLDCNFPVPLAVVWAHYLINGSFEEANELFTTHYIPVDKVHLIVLKAVFQQKNIKMGQLYISALNHQNVKSRCKERAYGVLLDVLVSEGRHDDAIALISDAKKNNVSMENHCRSTLIKLQNIIEPDKKEVLSAILPKVL